MRERLESLYDSGETDELKRRRKSELFAAAKKDYAQLRDASWNITRVIHTIQLDVFF